MHVRTTMLVLILGGCLGSIGCQSQYTFTAAAPRAVPLPSDIGRETYAEWGYTGAQVESEPCQMFDFGDHVVYAVSPPGGVQVPPYQGTILAIDDGNPDATRWVLMQNIEAIGRGWSVAGPSGKLLVFDSALFRTDTIAFVCQSGDGARFLGFLGGENVQGETLSTREAPVVTFMCRPATLRIHGIRLTPDNRELLAAIRRGTGLRITAVADEGESDTQRHQNGR